MKELLNEIYYRLLNIFVKKCRHRYFPEFYLRSCILFLSPSYNCNNGICWNWAVSKNWTETSVTKKIGRKEKEVEQDEQEVLLDTEINQNGSFKTYYKFQKFQS